jgi:hypothetical protein
MQLGCSIRYLTPFRTIWSITSEMSENDDQGSLEVLAAGVAGSGGAATQIAPMNELAVAFAALGTALNGLVTSLTVPLDAVVVRLIRLR